MLLREREKKKEETPRYLDLIFLVVVQRADGRAGFRLAASFLAAAFLRTLVRGHDYNYFFCGLPSSKSAFVFVR